MESMKVPGAKKTLRAKALDEPKTVDDHFIHPFLYLSLTPEMAPVRVILNFAFLEDAFQGFNA